MAGFFHGRVCDCLLMAGYIYETLQLHNNSEFEKMHLDLEFLDFILNQYCGHWRKTVNERNSSQNERIGVIVSIFGNVFGSIGNTCSTKNEAYQKNRERFAFLNKHVASLREYYDVIQITIVQNGSS